MNIQDIRRSRLRELIRARYNDRQTDFIAATEINQGELSLLLRNKAFGEKKARKIERLAGLSDGWLDLRDGGIAIPDARTIAGAAKSQQTEKLLADYSFLTEPQKKEIATKISAMAEANRALLKELSSGRLIPPPNDYVDRHLNHSAKRKNRAEKKT